MNTPTPKDSLDEKPPTSHELSLLLIARSFDLNPDEVIRRMLAGPVVQDPESKQWKRPPRPIPKGWRVIGGGR